MTQILFYLTNSLMQFNGLGSTRDENQLPLLIYFLYVLIMAVSEAKKLPKLSQTERLCPSWQ